MRSEEINSFKFGSLEFRTKGLGVFFPSEKLVARIQTMPTDEIRAANKAAWKLRRDADRRTERYSNVTIHGCGPWDRAMHEYAVAKAICAATWRALQ